jgi:hypothetical protein
VGQTVVVGLRSAYILPIWKPRVSQVPFKALMQLAATLTMVGLMESIAIAKALASASKQTLDANQELRGTLPLPLQGHSAATVYSHTDPTWIDVNGDSAKFKCTLYSVIECLSSHLEE